MPRSHPTFRRSPRPPARAGSAGSRPARWMALIGVGLLLGSGCTLPSLEPRGPRVEFSSPAQAPGGPRGAATSSELARGELRPLLLWRGEPLAIEWVDLPGSAGSESGAPAWVLHDLELAADGGRVERAHLRSNGERMSLPFDALHLARPEGSSAAVVRPTPRSAAWPSASRPPTDPARPQNGGEARDGRGDRHTPLFAERDSERLEGEFQDSEPLERPGQSLVVRLRSANNHYHRISLAPADWLATHQARPIAGGRLVVRGVRTRDARGALFVARELELDGRTVTLRREDGIPLWTPAPEPLPDPVPLPEPAPEPRPELELGSDSTTPGGGPGSAEPEGSPASPDEVPAARAEPSPEPLLRGGRLSAQALLASSPLAPGPEPGASRAFAVSALVLDLDAGRVAFLALRPLGAPDAEETWIWVPWEALDWPEDRPRLGPAAEPGPAPSAGLDARTLLPSDAVLARARRHWLGGT